VERAFRALRPFRAGAAFSRVLRDGCDAHWTAEGRASLAGLVGPGWFDGVLTQSGGLAGVVGSVRTVDRRMISDEYQNLAATQRMALLGVPNLERVHDHGQRDLIARDHERGGWMSPAIINRVPVSAVQ
jgi:hypothetical protein